VATKRFAVINGPNLNLLGTREPEIYGSKTLDDIAKETQEKLKDQNVEIEWFQSNIEGELVEKIQQLSTQDLTALIINPAAYSHTSIAILDALKMTPFPVVEVHLSNTHLREEFRSTKITAKASTVVMEGLGSHAYYMGIMSQLL
jgi:3-dehydroquinate dehydratase II